MTEPPENDTAPTALAGADPTRDIRLSPLPGLPRRETASDVTPRPPDTSMSAGRPAARPMADQPTDELNPPSRRPRERTIAFASPEMAGGRPAPTIGRTPRPRRRWPWVLLALLPIVVIAGAGVALMILLRGA